MLKIPVASHSSEGKHTTFSDDWEIYSKGTTGKECLGGSAGLKHCTRTQSEIDLKHAVNGFTSLIDYPAELLLPKSSELQVSNNGFPFRYSAWTVWWHSALIQAFIFTGKMQEASWCSFSFLRFWWSEITGVLTYPDYFLWKPLNFWDVVAWIALYFTLVVTELQKAVAT